MLRLFGKIKDGNLYFRDGKENFVIWGYWKNRNLFSNNLKSWRL